MALTHCQFCGHVVSTSAERCPSCGAPLCHEVHEPVETPPVSVEDNPTPPPVENNEPDFGVKKGHFTRNIIIALLACVIIFVCVFFVAKMITEAHRYEAAVESMYDSVAVDEPTADEEQSGYVSSYEEQSEAIPSYFVLRGEMAGFPMSVSCQRDEDGSLHGTYHNLTYGTEMQVEGYISETTLYFSGSVQDENYTFILYKASSDERRYEGSCSRSNGGSLSVWLEVQ